MRRPLVDGGKSANRISRPRLSQGGAPSPLLNIANATSRSAFTATTALSSMALASCSVPPFCAKDSRCSREDCGRQSTEDESTKHEFLPCLGRTGRQRATSILDGWNIDRSRIERDRCDADELLRAIKQRREPWAGGLNGKLAHSVDPGCRAAYDVRCRLESIDAIKVGLRRRVNLWLGLAACEVTAGELQLDGKHPAIVRKHLPALLDDRFAVGVRVRAPINGDLGGKQNRDRERPPAV